MTTARTIRQTRQAAALFSRMAPADRRTVLEILRRQVAGIPFHVARDQVCGANPPAWLNS